MKRIRLTPLLLFLMLTTMSLLSVSAQSPANQIISVTSQRFQHGEMIYRQDTGMIYVLEDTETSRSGTAWKYAPSQYAHLPAVNALDENDYYEPQTGFSKIWAHVSEIQQRLGEPVLPEIGFKTRTIRIVDRVFMERLDGLVYQIYDRGYWRYADSLPEGQTERTPVPPANYDGKIDQFSVTPQRATPSSTLTLRWSVTGTEVEYVNLTIRDTITYQQIQPADVNGFTAPLHGETTVNIPANSMGDLIIRLQAVKGTFSSGTTEFDREEIIVETETDSQVRMDGIYQPFENGFMIWLSEYDHVLEFYSNNTYGFRYNPLYRNAPEVDDITTPENVPALADAFKSAWNTQQDRIGYPTTAPQDYMLTLEQTDNADVLYTLPDGTVIRADVDVHNQGVWRYQQ